MDSVMMPDGSSLTADAFYGERDSRSAVTSLLPQEPIRVLVVLEDAAAETHGGQTALIWTASMLRRMGRSFSGVRIACTRRAWEKPYCGTPLSANGPDTFGNTVAAELVGADPFVEVDWSEIGDATAFNDVRFVIRIGTGSVDHVTH